MKNSVIAPMRNPARRHPIAIPAAPPEDIPDDLLMIVCVGLDSELEVDPGSGPVRTPGLRLVYSVLLVVEADACEIDEALLLSKGVLEELDTLARVLEEPVSECLPAILLS